MEFCKVALTFESVDKILWSDHSNEISQPVLSHDATCFSKFYKMKFGIFCRILFLATFGSERVNGKVVQIYLQPDWQVDNGLQVNHGMCSKLHTAEGPEQGFRHSFADRLKARSLFLAVVQASSNSFAKKN